MTHLTELIARLVYRLGRVQWRIDGQLIPLVAGADGAEGDPTEIPDLDEITTLDGLTTERSRTLDSIDDIVNTAAEEERDLTEEELEEHGTLLERFDAIEDRIRAEQRHNDSEIAIERSRHRRQLAVPMVNLGGAAPPSASHSLDELLHATTESVQAGTISRSNGIFTPTPGAINHVEPIVVERGGVGTEAPRVGDLLADHRPIVRRFQSLVADMVLFGSMFDSRPGRSHGEAFDLARSHPLFAERYLTILRAMDVDTAGEGAEWIPTGIGATLHEKVRAAGKVAPLFARVNIPTNPWKWPIEGSDATAYRVAEPTGDSESKPSASTPGTVAATFDAEILGGRVLFSRSVEADSVLAILPYASNKLAQAFADAEETGIINGDTDGTHQDADIGASTTAAQTLWDGLRKRGLANAGTDHSNADLTSAGLRNARQSMGKWGVNPASLAYIVGVTNYLQILDDANLLTVDKFGPSAVILNGQVGAVDGIPVVVSEHVREDVNASGVQDGVTTDRSYALCVNRGEWVMGQRQVMETEVDDSIYRETYQRVVVAFMREDFQNVGDASTNDDTAILYNTNI